MKIRYISPLIYPSKYVNRLQVMKVAESYSKLADFELVLGKLKISTDELFTEYNVMNKFKIHEMGEVKFWPRSFWLAKRISFLLKQDDDETIYYIRDVLLAYWLTILSRRFKNKYFFEMHSLKKFPDHIYKRILDRAKGIIITNNKKKKEIIEKYGIREKKIIVSGNGVDISEFNSLPEKKAARQKLKLQKNKFLVVYTGSVLPSYGSEIMKEVKENLEGDIDLLIISGIEREKALLYMRAADILIAPYIPVNDHFRYNMSPMKIKEYIASGTPLIASDVPAIREIVSDDTCLLIKSGRADLLKKAIYEIRDNYDKALVRARAAQDLANTYSWSNRAEKVTTFIRNRLENA